VLSALLAVLLLAPPGCRPPRDAGGHIKRDPKQRALYQQTHPCPSTGERTGSCPGWEVDHVCPLKCCGKDDPSNMQWQTDAEAKKKDAWELNCSSCGSTAPAKALMSVEPKTFGKTGISPTATPANSGCCKHCRTGCPCGDACISCDQECRTPAGCACKDGP
jgi:hypothetical protein